MRFLEKVYTENDLKENLMRNKKIAVLGYGSQGRAWALNMRDSGLNVTVGLERQGKSWEKAVADGFKPLKSRDAVRDADAVIFLVPDMAQRELYKNIMNDIKDDADIVFAHGFNVHYGLINPKNHDVYMVAPKAPGPSVREFYERGGGVPVLIAVANDVSGRSKEKALSIAYSLGALRAGAIETTFKEETETDLIGEQLDLVGGITELLRSTFNIMVEMGYKPEMAYFEAINEMKLIVDQVFEKGISGMLRAVSDTAKYGGLTTGKYIINDDVRKRMRERAEYIVSGKFAEEWIEEYGEGSKNLESMMLDIDNSLEEQVGKQLREIVLRGRPK
ncbi:ketol-acid reductoisomerase [Picrophilus oshimae]|uniref:ketol-acid reductoisomerase n=1 Tax=Picrophilus oshimae TaxID=46632 RepID=UPI00064F7954|nr:ketol-acid reductoisomerase [Picrophilus oshimae]